MRKTIAVLLFLTTVFFAAKQAKANPYLIYAGIVYGVQFCAEYGLPILAATGYGLSHTPSIHVFGTENTTVGFDWASLSNRSRNVYGLQLSLWGGGFAEDLFGVQAGILTSGWVEGYNTSRCRMNGLQFAPFAVKTSMVNGFQICPFYAEARMVNGFQTGGCCSRAESVHGIQCGIVNIANRVDGLQIGLYNATRRGYCLQVGLINVIDRRRLPFFPVLNASFR